jgi:hypothetical protein
MSQVGERKGSKLQYLLNTQIQNITIAGDNRSPALQYGKNKT